MKKNIPYVMLAIVLFIAILSSAYAAAQTQEVGKLRDYLSAIEDELQIEGDNPDTNRLQVLNQLILEKHQLEKENEELSTENKRLKSSLKEALSANDKKLQEIERLRREKDRLNQELKGLKEVLEERLEGEEEGKGAKKEPERDPGKDPEIDREEPESYKAYLTFDDGPSHNTKKVLDILKDYGVPATFFVIGEDTPFGHHMYRRMVEEGHALGNHTYTHDYEKIYSSPGAFMEDFYRLEELLDSVVGVKPDIMRFPGGSKSSSALEVAGYDVIHYIIKLLKAEGYSYFDWNISSRDASLPLLEKEEIVENVLSRAEGRKEIVVLFHDTSTKHTTVEALPEIIEGLKDKGYTFDVLSKDSFCVQFAR